jgi:uncharacterized protein (TIGR03086 family)
MSQTDTPMSVPAAFDRSVAIASEVVEAVTPDVMDRPTPCAGYDARRMLAHLVMVLQRVAAAGRGEPPMTWPQEDLSPADDEWVGRWHAAAADARAAWADPVILDRPTDVPWGTFSGSETLATYVDEVTVHTWDLSRAIGVGVTWDEGVLAIADAAIHAQLPLADRTPIWDAVKASLPPDVPWEDPFGPAVEVPADASAIDRLLAWNGRDPNA